MAHPKTIFSLCLTVITVLVFSNPVKAQSKFYYDSISKSRVYTSVDEMPEFVGGPNGWRRFLEKNLQVTEEFLIDGGPIRLTAIVEKNGRLSNLLVNGRTPEKAAGIESGFLKELLNTQWIPGKLNGKIVRVKINQTVRPCFLE